MIQGYQTGDAPMDSLVDVFCDPEIIPSIKNPNKMITRNYITYKTSNLDNILHCYRVIQS